MRATRAYITSLGTTGLLIASALMTLSVMSAFVAFNGFPGQDVQDPIGSLLMPERQATINVPVHALRVTVPAARSPRAGAATARRGARTPAGKAPVAHSNPVVNRAPATSQQPTRTQAPSARAPVTAPAAAVTTPLTGGGTPALPSTGVTVPPVPGVPVPALPQGTQLPLNTSGVTKVLGSG